jgi:hypothetical protein
MLTPRRPIIFIPPLIGHDGLHTSEHKKPPFKCCVRRL